MGRWTVGLVIAVGLACAGPPTAPPPLPSPAPPAAPQKGRGQHPRPADAERLVRDLYLAYGDACDAPPIEDRGCLSHELQRMVMAERKASAREGMPGKLGFDPIVDAQDCRLANIVVTSSGRPPDLEVVARFDNFGEARTVTFDLLVEDGDWKVDDLRTSKWDLRQLLGP